MSSTVTEELSHGAARIWCQVLQWSSVGSGGTDDDGVLQGISILQTLDQLGHSRSLLTDGNVNAVQLLLLIARFVESLLVDDGIDSDGSLSAVEISDSNFFFSN